MALTLIDLDGTLLKGPSSEKLFFLFLLKNRIIGLRQIAATVFFLARWSHVFGVTVFKKNKAYLAGLNCDRIKEQAALFVKSKIIKRFHPQMVQRIADHHKKGDVTVLLTGTLDMIAGPIGLALGIHYICATTCSSRNSIFTSNPPLIHPFGPDKLRFSKEICQKLGCELSDCTAYGNSTDDIPLLEAVAHPVAVYPDKGLRRHAREHSWECIE